MKQKEVVKYRIEDVDEQNDNHSQYVWFVHKNGIMSNLNSTSIITMQNSSKGVCHTHILK